MGISARSWKSRLTATGILTGASFALLLVIPVQNSAAAAKGKDVYDAKCAMCHAKDGSGDVPMGKRMKVKDLRSNEVQKKTDKELADITSNGMSPMPGYGSQLSKEQIQDIVDYIRDLAKKK